MSSSKLDFLDTLDIFAFLTQAELEDLARISTEYAYAEDEVLVYQRDVADRLYMVKSGRLFARSVDERGCVREARGYNRGDIFNDLWLFAPQAHAATVRATDAGRVVVIEREDFLDFLEQHPQALDRLAPEYNEAGEHVAGFSPEAWAEAQKSVMAPTRSAFRVGDLPAEELVEYGTRRSRWLLLLRLVPRLLVLGLLLLGTFFLSRAVPLLAAPPFRTVLPLALITFFAGLFLLHWLDWRNDFFLITTRHIIHFEYNLSLRNFGAVIKRTPIEQVQSVEVERPNFLANLLNIGTARITTAAQSTVIYFDYIDEPGMVRDTLERLQKRVRELDAGREQELMRRSLEEYVEVDAPLKEVEDEGADDENPDDEGGDDENRSEAPAEESLWTRLKSLYSARVIDGEVITYRKHPFVLLNVTRWPLLSGSVVFLLFAVLLYFGISSSIAWFALFLLGLAALGWLVWQVEDWRNDTFQVSNRYVIDIDRQPFGTGESRKQAELSNVQNINADRPGLLPTLFNYGNVYVETAGATADITFENVTNPNQVQRDIFERREMFQREQRRRQESQRRREYAVMLDVYHQAQEQDRIPRRTPPSELDS